jgi:hypothetical protein
MSKIAIIIDTHGDYQNVNDWLFAKKYSKNAIKSI